jgi:hypothetical protein
MGQETEMTSEFPLVDWLVLGLLAGAIGQIIRQISSVKKLMDEHPNEAFGEHFDGTRFGINVLVGATAGALGVLSIFPEANEGKLDDQQAFITLIGIGYAGADFIEAFVRRSHLPSSRPPGTPRSTGNVRKGRKT